MPMPVRPNYVNPLTMMKENRNNPIKKSVGNVQNDPSDKLSDLRTQQQSLQNEMLLIQSTGTDSSGNSSEKLEAIKKQLDEVSADLKVAENSSSGSTEKALLSHIEKPDVDIYEKTKKESAHTGIYRLEADNENSYKVSFEPYTET